MSVSSGWGRFTWGQANWNENQKFGAGWGAKTWNEQSWGDLNDVTVSLTDFSDVTYSSASFTANGALIYNTTTDGGSGTTDAVCVIAFGGDKTASNGTFKIEFPTANSSSAIIRLA